MRSILVRSLLLILAVALTSILGFAQEKRLRVEQAVLAAAIENREPVGVAESFPADVGTVYFHTTVTGEFGETTVEHVWLREGEEMARVILDVVSPRFRTWTAKKIPAAWAGSWEVRLVDADGEVLRTVGFRVE